MLGGVHTVQMCIVGAVKTKSEVLEHLGSKLMKLFICKNGHRFLSLKPAGEKSRNNEHS